MNRLLFKVIIFLALSAAQSAAAKLRIVTTTPDLASIVQAVGGDKVHVESLAKGIQNPHFVDAKPSLIVKLMKADLFVQTGLDLESGWAPVLIQSSGNKGIQPGSPGFLDASSAIDPMEIPQNPSRFMGDVHPGGNPHYLADPENGKLVAQALAEKLASLSPADGEAFLKNLNAFKNQVDENLGRWKSLMKPYAGAKFVSYHRIYPYFAARFGLISAGEVEPKPGIPPTAGHTAELIRRMKSEKIPLILTEPWFEKRTAEFISKQTGAAVIVMTLMPGGAPGAEDYISAIDNNVKSIVRALELKEK